MKRTLLLTLSILLLVTRAYADVFVVAGFKHDATNLSARVHQRKDNNDETCGLILVRTSILNLSVLANTGVVGPVNFKDGDYWVYVSPGTRRISFYKEGFVRMDYDLPLPVKSGETYLLNLRYRVTDNSSSATKMGFVVINSQPEGADVYINDSATGMQTPFQNLYPEGYYRFKLKKPFYGDYSGSFDITVGKTNRIAINLSPDFGELTVKTIPEVNAKVNIDGIDYSGTTPLTVPKLALGLHKIYLTKEMYLPWQGNFTIGKGKNTQLAITMKANFGTIDVNAGEGDAIYIDNQRVGTVKYQGRLLRGSHIIRVAHQNYYSQIKQIEIAPGQNLKETFNLKPKTGTLSVMTNPIGVTILLDNKPMGLSPQFIENLKVGTYNVKLQKQGYAPVEKQVEITENQTTSLKETLSSGKDVQIVSQPGGAKLYVDGKYEGITPVTVSLSFAKHEFLLEKNQYKNHKFTDIVTPDKSRFLFSLDLSNGKTFTSSVANIQFVLVQGGSFIMGNNDGSEDERPAHKVTVNSFYIGRYEITQKQWKEVMGTDPSFFRGCDDCPVERVSWNDVQKFLQKLYVLTGKKYRLPTEAEWEYAARGGNLSKGYIYSGSNDIYDVAWFRGNSGGSPHPVGQLKPNELGIYDMSGNVYEWCSDGYNAVNYSLSSNDNPKGFSYGTNRVDRGGSWNAGAVACKVDSRDNWNPNGKINEMGFRIVLDKQK